MWVEEEKENISSRTGRDYPSKIIYPHSIPDGIDPGYLGVKQNVKNLPPANLTFLTPGEGMAH